MKKLITTGTRFYTQTIKVIVTDFAKKYPKFYIKNKKINFKKTKLTKSEINTYFLTMKTLEKDSAIMLQKIIN
tara:strand:- start:479 stop:697 length:219 start_codon:yes stop_codon:yes gene_type:complete